MTYSEFNKIIYTLVAPASKENDELQNQLLRELGVSTNKVIMEFIKWRKEFIKTLNK